ncbi:hypothetical protein DOY81_000091 [Sarcophaga bullata]|nr:hypothetical protein DOY81_000091 [Sarcophaga bullata]
MVDYDDIVNLTRDELLIEYCKLFDRFQDLREANESDTQKIHELKRSLDTAVAAQSYLSQELEQYSNSDQSNIENELHKTQADLTELKKKYGKLEVSFNTLQQDYNTLLEENSTISKNLEEALKYKEIVSAKDEPITSEDDALRIQMLENENMDLLQKIEGFEERSVRYTLAVAECEKNIEILRDQITCLEENLQSKRMDLEEKLQILESTQEQLAEANAKIAMLSSTPDSNDRKGNSLFAEVDDQRQAMKQLLAAQKKSYLQMKKIYNESEHEIRRLKRENISMHTELEACSSIFCNADKVYQEKLNERVRHLLNQNEELERKLKWTQDRLKELACEKGVIWLDSMLSFCKKETDDLKSQLHSVRIQKASLEEQLRNAQQDMARWRFESLKSRCILLDREQLLTENNISFNSIMAIEYNISEKEQQEARPRIVSSRRSSTFDNIFEITSLAPLKSINTEVETTPEVKSEGECFKNIEYSKQNVILNSNQIVTSPTKSPGDEKRIKDNNQNSKLQLNEDTENNNNSSFENSPIIDNFANLKVKPPSPMRPSQRTSKKINSTNPSPPAKSILTKQSDSLVKDSVKNVKFSQKGDIVHNLSPVSSSSNYKTVINPTTDVNVTANKISNRTVTKQSRSTKSNIVVRRVFLSSKHD